MLWGLLSLKGNAGSSDYSPNSGENRGMVTNQRGTKQGIWECIGVIRRMEKKLETTIFTITSNSLPPCAPALYASKMSLQAWELAGGVQAGRSFGIQALPILFVNRRGSCLIKYLCVAGLLTNLPLMPLTGHVGPDFL